MEIRAEMNDKWFRDCNAQSLSRLMKEMGHIEHDKIFPQRMERLVCGNDV
jgi:hypothetical protein